MRRAIAFVLLLSLALPAPCPAVDPVNPPDPVRYACGTLSLYCLSWLEGRTLSLEEIEGRLAKPSVDGCSLKDLREAAYTFGLRLEAVELARGRRLDRPALALVRQGRTGHFFVIRPVGHTGKLVQVLNMDHEPLIVEAAELYASPEWTGLALVPTRPNWPARIAWGVAGASFLALATLRRPRRRPPVPPATGP